jgi:hypothetical protein
MRLKLRDLNLPQQLLDELGWTNDMEVYADTSMTYSGTLIMSPTRDSMPAPTSGRVYDGRTDKSRS